MTQILTFILIVTHVLINCCAWDSVHMAEDFDNHGYESSHLHLYSLLPALGDIDSDNSYDNHEAHIHVTYYLRSVDSFNFEQTIVQKRADIREPFENHAFSPPIPPPIA